MGEKHQRLGDFPKIVQNLNVWDNLSIRALHIFIYHDEGDDDNRERVENFTGFNYDESDQKFAEKLKVIKEKLSEPDLVSICAILNIPNYAKDLATYIFNNLLEGNLLKYYDPNHENEIDLGDYVEDDEVSDDDSDSEDAAGNIHEEETDKENGDKGEYLINRNKQRSLQQRNIFPKKFGNSPSGLPKDMKRFIETVVNRFNVSFKDVEDIIRPFNGSNDFPIEWWIKEFEETANSLQLNDVQKFVFGKKSLKGIAKLFIEAEKGIYTWNQLKNILMHEFKTRMSPMKLHDMLKERKKKKNESATEYYFQMKRIAKYSSLEEGDLIQYTIDGLPDDRFKLILNGARSIGHFREKLRDYDVVCDLAAHSEANTANEAGNGGKEKKLPKGVKAAKQAHLRCFNCGILGHTAAECKKAEDSNCDLCRGDHSSAGCEASNRDLSTLLPENFCRLPKKEVTIRGNRMSALVDSGSPLNLINITSHRRIGNPNLNNTGLLLQGFGKAKVLPVGYFEDKIEIDNDVFKTRFYVVSDDVLKTDMIIGNTLLDEAEFIFRKDEIFIRKIRSAEENAESMEINCRETFKIDADEDSESEEPPNPPIYNLGPMIGNEEEIAEEDDELTENLLLQRIIDEQEIMISKFQDEIENEKRETLELQRIIGKLEEEFRNLDQVNNQLRSENADKDDSWETQESVAAVRTKMEMIQTELMESRIKIRLQHEKLLQLNMRLEEKETLIQNYINKIESLERDDWEAGNGWETVQEEVESDLIDDLQNMCVGTQSSQIELGLGIGQALEIENAEGNSDAVGGETQTKNDNGEIGSPDIKME